MPLWTCQHQRGNVTIDEGGRLGAVAITVDCEMPLVLVHNDVVANPAHTWDDVEGVHYHYPSKYQGKVKTGEPFVYYRGVHRIEGKRGPAEYVGSGRIGDIWPDPQPRKDGRKAWYCAIDDYRQFAVPVPAKIDGVKRHFAFDRDGDGA
jgi:hypothetical protein